MNLRSLTFLTTFLFFLSYTFELQSQTNIELWGLTSAGGTGNQGVIFKTDSSGQNPVLIHSFAHENDGGIPYYVKLLEASNGKLYGMTSSGLRHPGGVLFEFDPVTHAYAVKHFFDSTQLGRNPKGSIIQASNGKLYGMTPGGGQSGAGVIFEYDITSSTYTKKLDLITTTTGMNPEGGLVEATNGKLYGLTLNGGASNLGVLFSYNISTNTATKLVDFDGTTKGSYPRGSLIQATNGKLYGVTTSGGATGDGVIFECDTLGNFVKMKDFTSATTGRFSRSELFQASNGSLYGMCQSGGSNFDGTFFEYVIATDSLILRHTFNGTDGENTVGAVIQVGNKLFGTTATGGMYGHGSIISYDLTTNILTKVSDFREEELGAYPNGKPMLASNGKIYGVTASGGTSGYGTIYQYDTSGTLTKLLNFDGAPVGGSPMGGLIQGADGNLYGMTKYGGIGHGIIFKVNPATNTFTPLQNFDGFNGSGPYGDLVIANNGKMYGLTTAGGLYNKGVLFEYNVSTNTITNRKDLSSSSGGTGSEPYGSLIKASNGLLYGLTSRGGGSVGTIFEFNPNTNIYTKKLNLNSSTTGGQPYGDLVEAGNGKLYGMTYWGGVNNKGAIFEYTITTNTVVKKVDFDNPTGIYGYGSMVEAQDGKLYGMLESGGANIGGVIFQYDPATNGYSKLHDFNGPDGYHPLGAIIETSTGRMFGMTREGGAGNGVLFELDTNGNYTKKFNFDGAKGAIPYSGRLFALSICPSTHDSITVSACDTFMSPGGQVLTASGTYIDTAYSVCNGDSINTIFLTILNSDATTDSYTSCDEFLWIDGNTYTSSNNTATYTLLNAAGCDSVLTLDLTIFNSQNTTDLQDVCDSLTWINGKTYYESTDTVYYVLTDFHGCDSTVQLDLNVSTITVGVTKTGNELEADELGANYQWLDCEDNFAAISGATSRKYQPTVNGRYAVAINKDQCNDTSECYSIDSIGVGISESNSIGYRILPNPSNGNFTITFDQEKEGLISLFDSKGNRVFEQQINKQKQLVMTLPESLSEGVYFLKFISSEEVWNGRLVLQR